VNRDLFIQRLAASTLSRWELADLLGIHPHDLDGPALLHSLAAQPVRVLIELSRRLDLHPADIVGDLEPLLDTPRGHRTSPVPNAHGVDEGDVDERTAEQARWDHDAVTLLTALASTSIPLTLEDLATALGWLLSHTHQVLQHAQARPGLGGPVALRRVPPDAWTITARYDVLSPAQRRALLEATYFRQPLSQDEVTVLLAVLTHGGGNRYAAWRQEHLDAEQALKAAGLIGSPHGPHHASLHPDVRYSLDIRYDVPGT
jgi:hypothetical protein